MSSQYFADLIGSWGSYAVMASLTISIIIAIAGVLPSIFVTGANVLVFGPVNGFIISWAGEVIGALVSFYLYRLGFKKKFESLGKKYHILDKIVSSGGFDAAMLTFQARLLPFVPSGFVTLACAVSSIGIIGFLISTTLGKLPSIALEALVSYDFINVSQNWIRLAITIAAVAGTYFLLRRRKC